MFKKASIVAALVLALSSGIMAAQDTALERTWKQQIPTAHLQYDQGHGNVDSWVGVDRLMNDRWNATYEKLDTAGVSFGYGLLENLEVRGFIAGAKYEDLTIPGSASTGQAYLGSVKRQVYNANGLRIAASGTVAHGTLSGTSYGVDAYANKIINDQITLYNNAGFTAGDGGFIGTMTNGLQYLLNDCNAVKAAVDLVYNHQIGQITPSGFAAVKTKVGEKTNNLLWANISKNVVNLNNLIESQVTPTLLIRGQADMTAIQTVGLDVSGNLGVEAEKQIGIVTIKGGIMHNLKADDWRIATAKAGVDVEINKNLKLTVEASNKKYYYPEATGQNAPSVNAALSYEL